MLSVLLAVALAAAQPPAEQADGVGALLARLQAAAAAGDRAAVLALARPQPPGMVEELAAVLTTPTPTRTLIKERDRTPGPGSRERVLIEIFAERGNEARLGTWSVDVEPGESAGSVPVIVDASRLSVVSGLYRLSLNPEKEYAIHDLSVRAPDLRLEMSSGSAFVAETVDGPTAVVLIGRGRMHFAPPDATERTQVRIFSGSEVLAADFDAAFLRLRPSDFATIFPAGTLKERQVNQQTLRRAVGVFDDYVGRTLQLDLTDLSRERWSLAPNAGDLIAEVRTRRFGSLTYTRSRGDAEDIAVFDRRRRRNIAVYASAEKLEQRGRYYSEDDLLDYDVLDHELDVAITPDRLSIEGISRLKVKIRASSTPTLNLRLAESLYVRGVYSPEFGRLLHLRVIGQNSLIVNLPGAVVSGTEFWVSVAYAGRLSPQTVEREAMTVATGQDLRESYVPPEPHFIYSNRSYWYPQSTVTDYATASLRISVPAEFQVVATGQATAPPAPPPGVAEAGQKGRRVFVFRATVPVRYLSCVISRFNDVETRKVALSNGTTPAGDTATGDMEITVVANPRQTGRVRATGQDAADILKFFASIAGSAPYPSFTIAAAESDRPGGHSPAYFAVLNQPVGPPETVWRNDPVSFENYPLFFLAHEIAHQWWGHAVGWKNYHEQWMSEGFAQYFAALYAENERGDNVLDNLIRQMRHTAIAASAQGPIYLGYRLGHIRGDDRVFRAIIYNKGAMVLHMLRRLIGDPAFFSGIHSFYEEWKFRKAGTDDFRLAMEKASGRNLTAFFEYWIHGAAVPQVKFQYDVRGAEAQLRFEQREPVDVPITVTTTYASGETSDIVVALTDRVTEVTIQLTGAVRTIAANADNAALVEIAR